ncbi:hypothetical protein NLI96_g9823 [Meripilus lineatus]|uniref:KOW domain-containing protein n=1 Tax=Meripilus lineatus TaxID=2056292 RepID=A0AAD5UZZ2_9APHY|nr:hypothetical protein NLI96_g9823 [Physisporinus lineatus]
MDVRMFLDLEAVVDNEESGIESGMEDELDGFIDDGEDIETETERFSSVEPPASIVQNEASDATAVSNIIRQRYSQIPSRRSGKIGSMSIGERRGVSQSLLFSLRTQKGMEARTVQVLEGYISAVRRKGYFTTLLSVKSFTRAPERVFVKAFGSGELHQIARQYSWMIPSSIQAVEQHEALTLFQKLEEKVPEKTHTWVRINCGLYKNDLALVESNFSTGFADVLVVPRTMKIDRRRPKRELLPRALAKERFKAKQIELDADHLEFYRLGKMFIKHGLHSLYIAVSSLRDALPSGVEELVPFVEAILLYGLGGGIAAIVESTLEKIKYAEVLTLFRRGDRVRAVSGAYIGLEGVLIELSDDDTALVELCTKDDVPNPTNMNVAEIRRVFKPGDNVRVQRGVHIGKQGVVVDAQDHTLTFSTIRSRDDSGSDTHEKTEVNVFCCDVEHYEPDQMWYSHHSRLSAMANVDVPELLGQRVEIIDGIYRGWSGYLKGWTDEGVVVKASMRRTTQDPYLGTPLSPPENINVPVAHISRCFLSGDQVFVKGVKSCPMFVHYDTEGPSTLPPLHPRLIPLVFGVYDEEASQWFPSVSTTTPVELVPRTEVMFSQIVHDPEEVDLRWSNPFRINWNVTVVKGPRKGYLGRVRVVRGNEVTVELEATKTIETFKPIQLRRRLGKKLVAPQAVADISSAVAADVPPAVSRVPENTDTAVVQCETPRVSPSADGPAGGSAWDPENFAFYTGGSVLLETKFLFALNSYKLYFEFRGTEGAFRNGKCERDCVRTVPYHERNGLQAKEGEVLVYMTIFSKRITSVPAKYLYPIRPRLGDEAIVWRGNLAGVHVWVSLESPRYDGGLTVSYDGKVNSAVYPPQDLVRIYK